MPLSEGLGRRAVSRDPEARRPASCRRPVSGRGVPGASGNPRDDKNESSRGHNCNFAIGYEAHARVPAPDSQENVMRKSLRLSSLALTAFVTPALADSAETVVVTTTR